MISVCLCEAEYIVRTTLRREQAPALRRLLYMQCISVAIYFPSASLSTPRWQPIFIPAQGSSYTTKTVGGEAVRRFFSLKYAVLLYTLSTLFTDPLLRKQKSFRKVFAELFPKSDRVLRVPAHPRIPASFYFIRTRRVMPFERAAQRASISSFVL